MNSQYGLEKNNEDYQQRKAAQRHEQDAPGKDRKVPRAPVKEPGHNHRGPYESPGYGRGPWRAERQGTALVDERAILEKKLENSIHPTIPGVAYGKLRSGSDSPSKGGPRFAMRDQFRLRHTPCIQ